MFCVACLHIDMVSERRLDACAGWAFDQEGIVRDVPASVNKVRVLCLA